MRGKPKARIELEREADELKSAVLELVRALYADRAWQTREVMLEVLQVARLVRRSRRASSERC